MFDASKNSKFKTEHGGLPVNSSSKTENGEIPLNLATTTEDETPRLQPYELTELSAQDGVSSSISSLWSSSSSSISFPSSSSSRSFPSSTSLFSTFPSSSAPSISHRYTEEPWMRNSGKPPRPKSQSYAELSGLKTHGKIVSSPSMMMDSQSFASNLSLSGFASNPTKQSQDKTSLPKSSSHYRPDQHLHPPKPVSSSQDNNISVPPSSQQDLSLQNQGQARSSTSTLHIPQSSFETSSSQYKFEKNSLQDQQQKPSTFVASSTSSMPSSSSSYSSSPSLQSSYNHGNIRDSRHTKYSEQITSSQHPWQTKHMHNNPRENSSRFAGPSLPLTSSQERLKKYSYTYDTVQTSSYFTASSSSSSSQYQHEWQKHHNQTSASSTLNYFSSTDPSPYSSAYLSRWNEYQASSSLSRPHLEPLRHEDENNNTWSLYPSQATALRLNSGQLRQDSWISSQSRQCILLSVISLCILTVILVVLPLYLPPLPPPPMELMMLPVVIFMFLICAAVFPHYL